MNRPAWSKNAIAKIDGKDYCSQSLVKLGYLSQRLESI